jgi:opacity protein-like surface antigen
MRRVLSQLTLSVLIILSFTNQGFADRKYFARSYMANTLPQRVMELEIWNTMRIGKTDGYYYRMQPRFEIEYGATDRLTTSFYMNFDQRTASENSYSSKPLEYSSSSIELRYRLTNPGDLIVDPALYFEFSYGGAELEYEPKIILSKRIGDIVTAVNFNGEIERKVIDSEHESKFELTAGVAYDLSNNIAVGLEFRNHRNYTDIFEKEKNQATFLGPTFNIQTEELYFTINFLKQVGGSPSTKNSLDLDGHEDFEIRTILGINL